MPELPEVETVRASLARDLIGKKIKTVSVTNGRVVRRHKTAKDFRALLEGHSIKSVAAPRQEPGLRSRQRHPPRDPPRHERTAAAREGPKDPKPKHTHVVFTFAQGGELRYVDPRTFGELYVSTPSARGRRGGDLEVRAPLDRRRRPGAAQAVPELAHLGIDPFEDQIGWDRFAAILRSRSTPLKVVLTDQDIIAGIGNIYADEILFAAGLRYDRPVRVALDHRDPTPAPRDHRDPDRGDQARWLDARRRAVRRPRRQARRRTSSSTRSTTARACACFQCRQPIKRVTVRGRSHVLLREVPESNSEADPEKVASVDPCFLSD